MPITAEDVRRLREETGAGMLDCKKALEDATGDFGKAKDILNEKGSPPPSSAPTARPPKAPSTPTSTTTAASARSSR